MYVSSRRKMFDFDGRRNELNIHNGVIFGLDILNNNLKNQMNLFKWTVY